MRMWMVDPHIMCNQHLLGEHVEIHMFIGTLKQGKSLRGYVTNNLVEPSHFVERHDALASEMFARGMNHHSNLNREEVEDLVQKLPEEFRITCVDWEISLEDLISRCPKCKERRHNLVPWIQ